ncbi:MAG: CAP domain-containing protein [Anaerolineales bacterium]|nr:CAP domain-containing protein [Anaerolineales bacterium]
MKRFATWILTPLLCLTVGLLPSIQADAQPGHFSPNLSAQALIAEVNALRVSNDLPPLQVNSILMRTAQTHADYISGTGVMTQFGADGKRPYQRALDAGYAVAGDISLGGVFAELIHSGTNLTPVTVVNAWKGAPNQLKVMLSSEFKDVGAGMAVVNGVTYYVLDAGAQSDAAVTSTPAIPGLFVISTAGARGTPEVSLIVSTPQPNGEVFHVIKKNEALWSIAVAYGVAVDELKLLNRLATDEIFEGQTLLVRAAHTETPPPTETSTMTATLGIPTSTATLPPSPTSTTTATPVPVAPASLRSGGVVVGIIVLVALLAAAIGSLLGRKKAAKAVD